jgi:hypothetical protein
MVVPAFKSLWTKGLLSLPQGISGRLTDSEFSGVAPIQGRRLSGDEKLGGHGG